MPCTSRRLVENLLARSKEWLPVTTRYETTATYFLGDVHLNAAKEVPQPDS